MLNKNFISNSTGNTAAGGEGHVMDWIPGGMSTASVSSCSGGRGVRMVPPIDRKRIQCSTPGATSPSLFHTPNPGATLRRAGAATHGPTTNSVLQLHGAAPQQCVSAGSLLANSVDQQQQRRRSDTPPMYSALI
eukprot:Lankesteria_metandrocarpae@DN4818_c0_g1_i1.p1